jgi:hypothetical protein
MEFAGCPFHILGTKAYGYYASRSTLLSALGQISIFFEIAKSGEKCHSQIKLIQINFDLLLFLCLLSLQHSKVLVSECETFWLG